MLFVQMPFRANVIGTNFVVILAIQINVILTNAIIANVFKSNVVRTNVIRPKSQHHKNATLKDLESVQ
jgi:hypothetical protein